MPIRRGRVGGTLVIVALAFAASACGRTEVAGVASPVVRVDPPSASVAPSVSGVPTASAPTTTASASTAVRPDPQPVAADPVPDVVGPPRVAPVERSGAPTSATVVADPVTIHIPSIGVTSPLVATGLSDDGSVAVPPDADVAGWFDRGPRPGERGPAVIMGHVDSARTGPGVFYRLRDVVVGDIVTIDTEDRAIDFVVERVEQHPKLEFPTGAVYGPTPGPALRLVTCGGSFDRTVRSYHDNIIVFLVPRTTP